MLLYLSALSTLGEERTFRIQIDEIEMAFDLLSCVVAKGDTLIEAHLLEQGKQTPLPVEVFDGQPFSGPLQNLELQWQLILNSLKATPSIYSDLIDWALHRIGEYEKLINNQVALINRFKILQERTQKQIFSELNRSWFIGHYEAYIDHYQNKITYLEKQNRHMSLRLNQLLGL